MKGGSIGREKVLMGLENTQQGIICPNHQFATVSFFTQNYVNGFSDTKAKIKRFFFNLLE